MAEYTHEGLTSNLTVVPDVAPASPKPAPPSPTRPTVHMGTVQRRLNTIKIPRKTTLALHSAYDRTASKLKEAITVCS